MSDVLDVLELYISIHASREGGDGGEEVEPRVVAISIHASREGGDSGTQDILYRIVRISIHASREGGDQIGAYSVKANAISIHASREGGDSRFLSGFPCPYHFNPRLP